MILLAFTSIIAIATVVIFDIIFMNKCSHEFEILSSGNITNLDNQPCGNYFNLRCKKCGDIQRRNFEA